jgi:hypothetical protein
MFPVYSIMVVLGTVLCFVKNKQDLHKKKVYSVMYAAPRVSQGPPLHCSCSEGVELFIPQLALSPSETFFFSLQGALLTSLNRARSIGNRRCCP